MKRTQKQVWLCTGSNENARVQLIGKPRQTGGRQPGLPPSLPLSVSSKQSQSNPETFL